MMVVTEGDPNRRAAKTYATHFFAQQVVVICWTLLSNHSSSNRNAINLHARPSRSGRDVGG